MSLNAARCAVRLAAFLLALLTLAGCGHDNPAAPEQGDNPLVPEQNDTSATEVVVSKTTLADYLPLDGGNQAYSFSISNNFSHYSEDYYFTHALSGSVTINFSPAVGDSAAMDISLNNVFEIKSALISTVRGYFGEERDEQKDLTVNSQARLILASDSLWYVPNDTSGNRTLVMNFDGDNGTLRELAPFLPPGWSLAPWESQEVWDDNTALVKGDTLIFTIDIYCSYTMIQRGTIKFLKGAGLESVHYEQIVGEGTLSPSHYTVSYTKI
ncbi:hypothetical protein LLH00_06970 [bacterium]|nr:hypothetical protein [bacterium]